MQNKIYAKLHDGTYSAIRPLLADKGYDSSNIRMRAKELDAQFVIPFRKNRKDKEEIDKEVYARRNVIERFFGRLKEFRRIATRYDKLDLVFSTFIILASITLA